MPYPDAPGPRLAYDVDGTQVFFVYSVAGSLEVVDTTAQVLQYLNVERNDLLPVGAVLNGSANRYMKHVVFFFPVPTRVRGFLVNATAQHTGFLTRSSRDPLVYVETSTTSTNGVDGTWSSMGPALTGLGLPATNNYGGTVSPYYDAYTKTQSMTVDCYRIRPTNDVYRRSRNLESTGWVEAGGAATRNVTALRFSFSSYDSRDPAGAADTSSLSMFFHSIHLYGEPDTTATEKRVSFWSSVADIPLAPQTLDWGDVPQGSSGDRSFRVRNMSSHQTATSITVGAYASPSVPTSPATPVETQLVFSTDGGITWDQSGDIPALSPGGVSSEILVRRVTPVNFELSNWAARVIATVGGWA